MYRNSTAAPWRPVTMRPLLRTNVGTAASVAALPDAQVYVRRIRYTPLDDAGTVIQSALSCTSMAACFGNMANNAAGMLQLSSPSMAAAGAVAGRKLLQVGPLLNSAGNVLSTPTAAAIMTPYLTELQTVSNATQYIVAAVLPGVLPSQVTVSITGHTISGTAYVSGFPFSAWTASVQAAFVKGLADDVVPTPDQVYVTNAADASQAISWQSNLTGPSYATMPAGASGVLVSYTVDGYQCDPAATTPCLDAGFTIANGDANVLNNINATNQVRRCANARVLASTHARQCRATNPAAMLTPLPSPGHGRVARRAAELLAHYHGCQSRLAQPAGLAANLCGRGRGHQHLLQRQRHRRQCHHEPRTCWRPCSTAR